MNLKAIQRPLLVLGLLLIGVAGGWLWERHSERSNPAGGLAIKDRAAMEQVVHDYLLNHPEILPQAMENLRHQDDAKHLAGLSGPVAKAFPGAVLGNAHGAQVLVEFTDYACGYCRKAEADVAALIAENPKLMVVIRELPILTPESATAAKMALAAAKQGKYAAFHRALFALDGPDARNIDLAAKQAGLDLDRARRDAADPAIAAEVERNLDFARTLGFNGTPSWVIGERLLSGAIGKDALAEAIKGAQS